MPSAFIFSSAVGRYSLTLRLLLRLLLLLLLCSLLLSADDEQKDTRARSRRSRPPAPVKHRAGGAAAASSYHNHRRRLRPSRGALAAAADRNRRSVNVYGLWKLANALRRFARIYSVAGNAMLEAGQTGKPSTTRSLNANTIVEILFACHMTRSIVSDGCHDNRTIRNGHDQPVRIFGTDRHSNDRANHVILLRFRATNRYLCIDSKAHLYLTDGVDLSGDCFFWHVHLFNQYDAYYSYAYPRFSDRCRSRPRPSHDHRSRRTPSSAAAATAAGAAQGDRCRRHWYIGVTKDGRLRTFQMSSREEARPKRRIFFIQRWTGETRGGGGGGGGGSPPLPRRQYNQSLIPPNAARGGRESTPSVNPEKEAPVGGGGVQGQKQGKRSKCNIVLSRCSNKSEHHLGRKESDRSLH